MPVSEDYGLTETSPTTHMDLSGFSKIIGFAARQKYSIGVPVPDTDVKLVDEDGYFYIVDRIKDMANVSGYKVYTNTIDDILHSHPAVVMAVTIGIPDHERQGSERIKAFVVLKEEYQNRVSAEEIIEFCRDKCASYAVPRHVEFRETLPLTVTEKIFKRELREEEISKMRARGLLP
ncbi:MAG: hypothetical protein KGZ79_07875 [Dethiobacter sp.]|nr:hypothetical protein [Dethiobacter sp.]